MNLIRLVLAAMVLVAHARLTYGAAEPVWAGRSVGTWAVAGFFVVSGYLITVSRSRHGLRVYLIHRLARLYPGYWLCLVVTAVLAVLVASDATRDSVMRAGLDYVAGNASLVQVQGDIAGTPVGVPYPGEWNASLWTLAHELACYLVVGVVALAGPTRLGGRAGILKGLILFATTLGLLAGLEHVWTDPPFTLLQFARLATFFFGGALVAHLTLMGRVRPVLGLASGAVFLASVVIHPHYGPHLAAPLLCLALLGAARACPCPGWIARHDLSYGVYLYAFPISQAWARLTDLPFAAYAAAVVASTVLLAAASWFLIERPALRWSRAIPRTRPAPLAAPIR
jgi:peptidoglycan/LPS O-acetylase OafA/YrhL